MKKYFFSSILAFILIISLVACQAQDSVPETSAPEQETDSISETSESEPEADSTSEASTAEQETDSSSETSATEEETDKSEIALTEQAKLVAMKGPTAMGLAQYTSEKISPEAEPTLNYEIMTMPDQVAAGLIKGDIDLACIPANMAATVYNKSQGKIQVAAINVLNVLYFATNNTELNSLEDLRGQTIYSTGKGATPEVILENLLNKAGLEIGNDVTVNFYPEATEVASLLQAEEGAIALLQEPFLSSVTMKNEQIEAKLNVNDLWQEYFEKDSGIVTGVLVAQKDFIQKNQEWFDQFLEDYRASAEWVSNNPVEAAKIIEEQDIIGAPVAEKAIPNIGISLITGQDLQTKLSSYLEILATNNPELVGGELPEDDFYY